MTLWLAGMTLVVAQAAPVDVAKLAEEVKARETAFAKTMADRDLAAFGSFLADEAIFIGAAPLRGKLAVIAGWKTFYDGEDAPFSWRPALVQVLDSGTLALSTGPVFDPAGHRVGAFNSTWRREKDGAWKIVLDNGCPPCAPCGGAPPVPAPAPAASPRPD